MHFSRVVGVVASSWSDAARAANDAAGGRGLFPRDLDEPRQAQDVQREVCDDILYLVLALDPVDPNIGPKPSPSSSLAQHFVSFATSANPAIANNNAGVADSQDNYTEDFAAHGKHDLEALRRLLFVFSCAHVLIWVQSSPAGLSLTTFGLLNALKASRPRSFAPMANGISSSATSTGHPVGSSNSSINVRHQTSGRGSRSKDRGEQVRGWPGRSTPYLVFGFSLDDEVSKAQGIIMGTLKACGLVGNPTRSSTPFCRAVKNDCCCAVGNLRPCVNRLIKQAHVDTFTSAEWLKSAGVLAVSIRLSARSGLVAALETATQHYDVPDSNLTKKDAQSLARLESATKSEDALCRALADKGMPFALETYVRNLPPRYGTQVHESHLELAVRELRRFTGGRGSVARRAEKRLTDQCKRIWRGQAVLSSTRRTITTSTEKGPDRRLCDAISLTGRSCVNLLRENLAKTSSGRPGTFDPRSCCSGATIRMACSCGRSVLEYADPFLPGLLNHTYPSHSCCEEVLHRTHDLAIGTAAHSSSTSSTVFPVSPSSSFAGGKTQHIQNPKASRPQRKGGSWMLHDLGPAHDYDPSKGIPYPGFLPRYNRLDLWDETKVYVGLEYESIGSGNRCFYSVSGLYSTGQGLTGISDDTHGFMQWPLQDVELFIAPSNVAQDTYLQLQRIYICVPEKAAYRVLLHAHIHFRDAGNALFTHRPMELSPGRLYCMCLPHVYLDAQGQPIFQPTSCKQFVSIARLRPGLLKAVTVAN